MGYLSEKGIVELGTAYEQLALKVITHLVNCKECSSCSEVLTNDSDLPKPAWIVEDITTTQRPNKRSHQSSKPRAKRQRRSTDNCNRSVRNQASRDKQLSFPSTEHEASPRDTSTGRTTTDSIRTDNELSSSRDQIDIGLSFQTSQPLGWDQEFEEPPNTQENCTENLQQVLPIAGQVPPNGCQDQCSAKVSRPDATEIMEDSANIHRSNIRVADSTDRLCSDEAWNATLSTDYPPLNWDQDLDQILGMELAAESYMPLNWDQDYSELHLTSNALPMSSVSPQSNRGVLG